MRNFQSSLSEIIYLLKKRMASKSITILFLVLNEIVNTIIVNMYP